MPMFQSFNKRTGAWVKYKKTDKGTKIVNVKEQEPKKKFAGVPVRGQRK